MSSVVDNQLPCFADVNGLLSTSWIVGLMSPRTVVSSVKLNDMIVPVFVKAVVGQQDPHQCYLWWDEKFWSGFLRA